jgi:hypothetical protein
MHVPDHLVTDSIDLAAPLSASGFIATCARCAGLSSLAGSNNGKRRAALTP